MTDVKSLSEMIGDLQRSHRDSCRAKRENTNREVGREAVGSGVKVRWSPLTYPSIKGSSYRVPLTAVWEGSAQFYQFPSSQEKPGI